MVVRSALGVLLVGWGVLGCSGPAAEPPPLETAGLVVPMLDSMTVELEEGVGEVVEDGAVVWRTGLTDWVLRHDIDGDGDDDALVVTFETGGGSGVFFSLTLLTLERTGARDGGRWLWRAAAPLGDRVRVRAATIDGSTVELHLTEHGPDDALCCPSVEVERAWEVTMDPVDLVALDLSALDGGPS